jgi:hypothetical protein
MIVTVRGKCDLCPDDEPAVSPSPGVPMVAGDPNTWGPAEPGIDSIVQGEATTSSGSISQLKKSVAEAVTEAVADSCTGDITAVGQALAVAVANASATAWVSGSSMHHVASTHVQPVQ